MEFDMNQVNMYMIQDVLGSMTLLPTRKWKKITLLSDRFCHFQTRIENFLDFLTV